jgi:hypothetical protein
MRLESREAIVGLFFQPTDILASKPPIIVFSVRPGIPASALACRGRIRIPDFDNLDLDLLCPIPDLNTCGKQQRI